MIALLEARKSGLFRRGEIWRNFVGDVPLAGHVKSRAHQAPIGLIGLALCGEPALLRSLVVAPSIRAGGAGTSIRATREFTDIRPASSALMTRCL